MKEYLLCLKQECTPDEIWSAIKKISRKTIKLEIVATIMPIFLVGVDEYGLNEIKQMPEVDRIENNDSYGAFNT